MSDGAIIKTRQLSKSYGAFQAVRALDLEVREREIFGLLGPNGAGKSTTILMLLGLTEPTSGEASVCGYDPVRHPLEVKRQVGYLPEKVGFYEELTAEEDLKYTAYLNGLSPKSASERIKEALKRVGLADVAQKRVGQLSHGMKQRLGIADVLVKAPRLVILDEPAAGIDPEGVSQLLELITRLNRELGMTVVFCTHMLQQVEKICHRVGVMAHGQMVGEGNLEELKRGKRFLIEVKVKELGTAILPAIQKIEGIFSAEKRDDGLLVESDRDVRSEVAKVVVAGGGLLEGMKLREHSLEDIYRRYVREA
ncbi:MAG: putative transporter ATP-binding protein [Dehalococcoidia bacterium]|nr:putative transporter ATP-binding protein [Dehalococcoidia bacterium]